MGNDVFMSFNFKQIKKMKKTEKKEKGKKKTQDQHLWNFFFFFSSFILTNDITVQLLAKRGRSEAWTRRPSRKLKKKK